MAAKHCYRRGFLLLLFNFFAVAALDKRFSDFKRCADEECSMLLCRGKAIKDFSGPDCRFLSFKESETVYVYYKLSGMREDMWAGSVGSKFGYFPKDLLAVNHLYTEKELEVPAEETDFVCFENGFDKFDNYNIDLLLGYLVQESDNRGMFKQIQVPEDTKETPPSSASSSSSVKEETESENPAELDGKPEDLGKVPDDPSSSLSKLDSTTEPPPTNVIESDTAATPDTIGNTAEDTQTTVETVFENVDTERSKTKDSPIETVESVPEDWKTTETENEPVSISKAVEIPELKTTLGTTFDAVTTDEEFTTNVTPYEEEERTEVESHPEDDADDPEEIPLLSFSEESVNSPASDTINLQEIPPEIPDDRPKAVDEKNMWTSFGDAVFSAVTGVDTTAHDMSSEEDDDEEEDEEEEEEDDAAVATPLSSFEDSKKKDVEEPLNIDSPKQPENTDQLHQDSAEPRIVQSDDTVTNSEEQFHEDGSDVAVTEHEDRLDETLQPIDKISEPNKTESNVVAMDPVLQDPISVNAEVEISDNQMANKPPPEDKEEEEVTNALQIGKELEEKQHSHVATDLKKEIDKELNEEETMTNQESAVTQAKKDQDSEKVQLNDSGKDEEKIDDASLPDDIHESLVRDEEQIVDASQMHEISKDIDVSRPGELDDSLVEHEEEKVDPGLSNQSDDSLVKDVGNKEDASQSQIHDFKDVHTEVHTELPDQVNDSLVKDVDNKENASPSQIHDTKDVHTEVHTELPDQVNDSLVRPEENTVDASPPHHLHDSSVQDVKDMVDSSIPGELGNSLAKEVEEQGDTSPPDYIDDSLKTNLEQNSNQQISSVEEPEIQDEVYTEEREDQNATEVEEENEELLEDENALLSSQSDNTDPDKPSLETNSESVPEPQYSDSIMRLMLLREHFTEEQMHRFQRLLGLKNLIKVEAMFSDLDTELQATRLSYTGATQDIESALESILESSENTILDEIEKMLDSRETIPHYDHQVDTNDEETQILEDFQELAFSLRHKYSTVSDSTPLATDRASDIDQDKLESDVKDKVDVSHQVEEDNATDTPEPENGTDNHLTITDHEERPVDTEDERMLLDKGQAGPEINVEEDGGHFNKNKDNQPGFSESDEMQKVPQATLENPLDLGLGVEVENSPSGSLDSMKPVSEIHEEEVGAFTTGIIVMSGFLWMCKSKIEEWTIVMISLLPEEWKPGETLYGCPWQAVVITALVGVVTFTLFFWRTVLAVKKREYLVDEKKLTEQIQALKKEKNDVMEKMTQLQKQTEQLKENQKHSKEAVSCTNKKMEDLESKVLKAETQNQQMVEEKNRYIKLLEEERSNSLQNLTRIEKLEKTNEKLQLSRKKVQEALAKTTVLLDEAKIREDARNVHQKSLEKDFAALKEENRTLKVTIKNWEDKHMELSEQIKVYHKSQKDLEDSLVLKDHNVEVLSELLADLDACDSQKIDSKVLANGEVAPDKKTFIKNRIKQMMDVSRVQTTLTVVEEERDRFMSKLLSEEKARKTLEEQHQELEHAIATLKSEKSHVDNQLKILQQKNEIMVEMYQQKENALQQRLTKEELERRSKENLLSEVGGKAVEAEEQVKVLRQRINEMEEQMKKTEEVYKEQIKEQENKTHSNWVSARNAERALNQEKLEASKLREKLAVLTSQLNERRAPLFRPNSGQPPGPRQGDSYAPSPVSGGAPSPPLMIEGPRRPPSAPVGRRIDPYGPRPPSDPHGRYAENKHISGMDMMGPRSSSPANMDVSTQAVNPQITVETQAEASTESPEPGPGSFLASPIRDSPGPMGPGPHEPLLPPGPHGRLPPPGLYRPPRPGLYHIPPGPHGPGPNVPPSLHGPPLPANGGPGMPLPGPMGGEFGPRPANGHTFPPRLGPGPMMDPRGPLPPHFRPPLPSHLGPMPPPTGFRGAIGPRQPFPPDMRFGAPPDHASPPMDMLPGVPPHPSNAFGQSPPNTLHNSVGAPSGQDLHMKQEAPQDSATPAMVKP